MKTKLLYDTEAYVRTFTSEVVAVEGSRVALEATAFYPTGGGQPHDLGILAGSMIVDVTKTDGIVWHTLDGHTPGVGEQVEGELDWDRRHALMRTHTCLHVLSGVIWKDFGKQVTGGNMEPLSARMDFEFDPLPADFATTVENRVNEELRAARPIEVSYIPRSLAVLDDALVRTKVNLVPEGVTDIRVVDIVGLDRQADGGTHVLSTAEVGVMRVTKAESKGKANKRIRIVID